MDTATQIVFLHLFNKYLLKHIMCPSTVITTENIPTLSIVYIAQKIWM